MKCHDQCLRKCLAIIMLISIICSIIYVGEGKYHECTGEDCPICLQLHRVETLLNTLKEVIVFVICINIPVIVLHVLYRIKILRRQRTLVTMKVQLLN